MRDEKIPIISFVANTGGLLGLCMGFSLVSVFEIMFHCGGAIKKEVLRRRKLEQSSCERQDYPDSSINDNRSPLDEHVNKRTEHTMLDQVGVTEDSHITPYVSQPAIKSTLTQRQNAHNVSYRYDNGYLVRGMYGGQGLTNMILLRLHDVYI